MIKSIGFDIDGTILVPWTGTCIPAAYDRITNEALPDTVFLATNQAGLAWRRMTGNTDYPSVEEKVGHLVIAYNLFPKAPHLYISTAAHPTYGSWVEQDWMDVSHAVAEDLQLSLELYGLLPQYIHISADPAWRKPAPGMLSRSGSAFWCRTK